MADYISCVEASGGNSQRIATEITNANAGKTDVGVKGSGSGVVAKGSGSVTVDRATEQALASKFEHTWTDKGMEECRKVLDPPKPPRTRSSVKGSTTSQIPGEHRPDKTAVGIASHSDNVTEGVWFGVQMDATQSVRDDFGALDPKYLDFFKRRASINTIDQMPSDFYDKAWESTFAKILICGQDVSSAFTFVLAEHPQMMLSMGRMATPQRPDCATSAIFSVPYMDRAAVLIGSNPLPKLKYILDFPVSGDQDSFGLRFHLRSAEIRALDQGTLPSWKSFAIDNPDESLVLRITRRGASWNSIPELDRSLPEKILVRTGLESGGPWVVREYQLISRTPHLATESPCCWLRSS